MSQESSSQKGVLSDEELYKLILKLEGKKTEEISQNIKPLLEGLEHEGFIALLNKAVYAEALNNTFFRESSMAKVLVKIALEAEMENQVFQAFRNIEHANQKVYDSVIGNEEGFKNLYRVILIKEDVSASELKQKHQQLLGMSPDPLSDFVDAVERVQAENIARSPQVQNVSTNNAVPKEASTPKQTSKPWWPDFRKILKLKPNISGQDIVNFINDHKPSLPAFLKERPKGIFSQINFKSILEKVGIKKSADIPTPIVNTSSQPVTSTVSPTIATSVESTPGANVAVLQSNQIIGNSGIIHSSIKGLNTFGQGLIKENNQVKVKYFSPFSPLTEKELFSIARLPSGLKPAELVARKIEEAKSRGEVSISINATDFLVANEDELIRILTANIENGKVDHEVLQKLPSYIELTDQLKAKIQRAMNVPGVTLAPGDFKINAALTAEILQTLGNKTFTVSLNELEADRSQAFVTVGKEFPREFYLALTQEISKKFPNLLPKSSDELILETLLDKSLLELRENPHIGVFINTVFENPSAYGFDDTALERIKEMPLAVLISRNVMLSQQTRAILGRGYQVEDGKATFTVLSACGMDFPRLVGVKKFFFDGDKFKEGRDSVLKESFELMLRQELDFCQQNGYTAISMLPRGLGAFLEGVPQSQQGTVVKMYFDSLAAVAQEKKYENIKIYLNPVKNMHYAKAALKNYQSGAPIILHDRDSKEVALTLAESGEKVLLQNASDAKPLLSRHMFGMYARIQCAPNSNDYVGEEIMAGAFTMLDAADDVLTNEARVVTSGKSLAGAEINSHLSSTLTKSPDSFSASRDFTSDLPFAAVTQTESMKEHAAVRERSDSGTYVSLGALSTLPSTELVKEPEAIKEVYAAILNGINNQSLREAFIQKIEKIQEHTLQDPSQYSEEKLRAFVDVVNTALNSEKGFNRNNQEEIIKEAGLSVFFGLYAFEFPDDGNPQFVDKGLSPDEIKAAEEARIAAEKEQAAQRMAAEHSAQEKLLRIRKTIDELKQPESQTQFPNTRKIVDEETAALREALTRRIQEAPSINATDQIQDIKSVSVNSALEEILRKDNPEQIADLLMQKSHQLFLSLDPQEVVLGTDKYLKANPGAKSGMQPMVDYKNQLTETVYLIIKNASNDEERAKIGANLVNAAVIARDKRDYQTLLAFLVAFQRAKKDFSFHKTLNIDNEGQKEYELSTLLTGEGDIGELMKMQYDNNLLIVVPSLQVFNRALELASSEKNQKDIISRINTMKGAASLPSALKQQQEALRPYWDAVLLSLEMADKHPDLCVYKLQNLYNAMKSLGMDPDTEKVVEGLEAMYGRISSDKHSSLAMVKQLASNISDHLLPQPLELQNPQVKFIRNFVDAFNTTKAVSKVPKYYANDKRAKKFSKTVRNFEKLNKKEDPFTVLNRFGVKHTAVILGRYDKTRNLPIDLVVRYIIDHPQTAADFLKKPSLGSRNFRAEVCRNPDLIYQLIDSGNLEILIAIKGDPDNNKPGLLESWHLKIAADEKIKLSNRLEANIKLKKSFSIIDNNAIEQLKKLEQTLEKQDTLDKKYQEFNNNASSCQRMIDGLLYFKGNVSASTELTSEAKRILLASIDEKYNSYNAKFQELVAKFKDEVELPYQAAHAKKSSDSAINASAYEMIGKRPTQEDAVIHTSIAEEFGDLSFDSQKDLFNKTFQKMQEKTDSLTNEKSKDKKPGSTAIVCAIQGKKIVTATVGDSTAYVVIKDKEGNIIECRRLNKKLHDLHDTEERARITNFVGKELKEGTHRLVTGIAVTRGLGDQQHEAGGLIHDPDIYSDDISIPKGGNAFVVVSCDGLSEKAKGGDDSTYIKNLLIKCGTDDLENLPERLAKAAYEDGSQDNISVLVTPLEKKSSTVKLVGVFDGHSGNEVSHMLQENFVSEFNNLLFKPEYTSEFSKRRSEKLNDEADKIASKAEITKEVADLVELEVKPMTSPEGVVVKAISVKELLEVIESPERLKEILETNPRVVMPLINLLERLQQTETTDLDEQARHAQELQIIIGNLTGLAEAGSFEAAAALAKHYAIDQFFDAELGQKWIDHARNILSIETQKYEVEVTRTREENERNFKGCIKALDKIHSPAYKAMLTEAFERRFNNDPAGRIPQPDEIDAFINKANQLLEKGLTYQQHEDLIKEHKVEFLRIRNPKVFGEQGIKSLTSIPKDAVPSEDKDKKVKSLWEKVKTSNPPPAPTGSPKNKN